MAFGGCFFSSVVERVSHGKKSIRFVLRKLHEEFRSFRQWLGLYFSSLYGIFMTGVVLHVLNFSSRVYFVPSLCSKKEWWLLRDRPSEL